MIGALLALLGTTAVVAGVRSNRRRMKAVAEGSRVVCVVVGKKKRYDYDARGHVAAFHFLEVLPDRAFERRAIRVPVPERVHASTNVDDTIELYGPGGWPTVLVHQEMPESRRFGLIGFGAVVGVVGVVVLLA